MAAHAVSLFFRAERRSDSADLIARDPRSRGRSTSAGVFVDEAASLRHSAVWASLSAIAEAVQQLPLDEVRANADGTTVRRRPPAVFYQPTPDLPWETWIWQQAWALAASGRCYALVTSVDAGGWPRTLVPVGSSDVVWKMNRLTGAWDITVGGSAEQLWPLGRLWHCPLYVTDSAPWECRPLRTTPKASASGSRRSGSAHSSLVMAVTRP